MIDRLERLINLVIALRETRRPLPADEIRRRVAGYGQDEYESFRRMFERDKSDLRGLGIPIETVDSVYGDDVEGYRIDPKKYDLPPVDFAHDELAALALALQATGLMDAVSTGLRKLQVGSEDKSETASTLSVEALPKEAVAARLEVDDPNRGVLTDAQMSRTRVRFSYRRADGQRGERKVEPHGLVFRRGYWYLVGVDTQRNADRSFRLDRIEGRVKPFGRPDAFDVPPEPVDVDAVLPPTDRVTATVAVTEDLAWTVARQARGEHRVLPDGRISYEVVANAQVVESWAFDRAPDLEVLEPVELRERIARRVDEALADSRNADHSVDNTGGLPGEGP